MSDGPGDGDATLPEPPLSSEETLTGVRIAERYLAEAERVLWETADRTADADAGERLEAVTSYVWTVQNELDELEHALQRRSEGTELEWYGGD